MVMNQVAKAVNRNDYFLLNHLLHLSKLKNLHRRIDFCFSNFIIIKRNKSLDNFY